MNLFRWRSQKETTVEGTIQGGESSSRKVILFLYHERDRELWYHLAPHINTLVLRLHGRGFIWEYYTFAPAQLHKEHEQHEAFVGHLQNALLFLPCTSAEFIGTFLRKAQSDPRIREALNTGTQMQPIPFRAAHGVSQSLLARPFAAYAAGHERDEAAAHIIAGLEKRLLPSFTRTDKVPAQTTLFLAETSIKALQLS